MIARLALLLLFALLACRSETRPVPPGVLDHLDPSQYAHRTTLLAHHFPGQNRPGKIQMMALGDRRYLFQLVFDDDEWNWLRARGEILDVTNPLEPVVVNENGFRGYSINLAWHDASQRWVLMQSMTTFGDPAKWAPGLRGVGFLDVTNPREVSEISAYSTDDGDPDRIFQTGSGTHRDYWDGGRYAYLGAAEDDAYFPERPERIARYSRSLQILDLEQLESPHRIGAWWVRGQKRDETAARDSWRSKGDSKAFDNFHGPEYVPRRVEEGGRYGYGGWGTFGVLVHDLSDPAKPQLVGRWEPGEYIPGPMMPHHTVDVSRLDRGFVVSSPESIATECTETWHDTVVLDVREPSEIRRLGTFPVPKPPPEAPYQSFCLKRGRFGPHNSPHLKAPGSVHPNITFYTYFNGGLQVFDLSDPTAPENTGWFIPAQGGRIEAPDTFERGTDGVFVEWDRRLVWLATDTGLYLLASDDLGAPELGAMPVERWSPPGLNDGHP